MRVLYVIDGLGPGGAERSLAAMSKYLVQSGVDLHVATLHDREGFVDEVRASGATLHNLGGRPSRVRWLRELMSLVSSTGPDLVHTTLFDSDVLGRVASRVRRVPVVSSLVNVQYAAEQRDEFAASRWRRATVRGLDMTTARLVRRFHAVSNVVANEMSRTLRIPRERIDVIPRGRDRSSLGENAPERRARSRAALGLESDTPVVLCVARHDYAKGLDVLVPAWALTGRRLGVGVLLIAGRDGTRTAELRQTAATLGLDEHTVRFLGVRSDVADLLCAADAFVLPSRREGLPGALLEAMAMSVPIVATSIDATLDAIPSDEFARLVPVGDVASLADALATTLADVDEARARARRARARFDEEFTIERVSARMRDFYDRAVL